MNGVTVDVSGTGWYDHEFGGTINRAKMQLTQTELDAENAELKARAEGTYVRHGGGDAICADGWNDAHHARCILMRVARDAHACVISSLVQNPNIDAKDELKLKNNKPQGLHGVVGAAVVEHKENGTSHSVVAHHQNLPEASLVNYAWNWLAVQLEDGMDITATTLVNPKTDEVFDNFAVIVDADSTRTQYNDVSFKGSKPWVRSVMGGTTCSSGGRVIFVATCDVHT